MNDMIRVEGEPHLYRDGVGAIHNTDHDAFRQFIQQRELKNKDNERVEKLEKDMSEIKSVLAQILGALKDDNK